MDVQEQVLELSAQGLTVTKIARALKIPRRQVVEALGGRGSVSADEALPNRFDFSDVDEFLLGLYDRQHPPELSVQERI